MCVYVVCVCVFESVFVSVSVSVECVCAWARGRFRVWFYVYFHVSLRAKIGSMNIKREQHPTTLVDHFHYLYNHSNSSVLHSFIYPS